MQYGGKHLAKKFNHRPMVKKGSRILNHRFGMKDLRLPRLFLHVFLAVKHL